MAVAALDAVCWRSFGGQRAYGLKQATLIALDLGEEADAALTRALEGFFDSA